jgi:hypothetical protein
MSPTQVIVADDRTEIVTDPGAATVIEADPGAAVDAGSPLPVEVAVAPVVTDVATAGPTEVLEVVTAGPQGPPGPTGAPGPPGPQGVGAATTYTHVQSTSATSWVIAHGLGRHPSIELVDSAGTVFQAEVRYDSPDQITVTLSAPTSGVAYLN